MHYLITGHTGFKGAWLSLLLNSLGHKVSGIALDPEENSLFSRAKLAEIFEHDIRLDIRNAQEMAESASRVDPDVLIHLAAQPLVRESYRIPLQTFEINTIGTLNVLEATRNLENLKAALIITTDKVYKNLNHLRGYTETDELGGDDPYSASKAAADIATQSWMKSFSRIPISIARAGNVIGGGDFARERLIPDLVQAYSMGDTPKLRYPDAIRPWQHVLDCLHGYLLLVEKMLLEGVNGLWNFGPSVVDKFTVSHVAREFAEIWGIEVEKSFVLDRDTANAPYESGYLLLDSSKARQVLGWKEKLDFRSTLEWTAKWFKYQESRTDALSITTEQIKEFNALKP
jgi:CDP-glucose 4,6-dehydratase